MGSNERDEVVCFSIQNLYDEQMSTVKNLTDLWVRGGAQKRDKEFAGYFGGAESQLLTMRKQRNIC